jgi:hypothetical protein
VSTAKPTADDWGVFVNECGIFASAHGEGAWLYFLSRARDERLTMLWLGPCGGEWHVMCGTKEAAAEGREIFVEQGIHKTHVKVARLSACRAKVAGQRRRWDERTAEIEVEIGASRALPAAVAEVVTAGPLADARPAQWTQGEMFARA